MIGKTISHYKILKKIGQGGMEEIYLAEDTKLKRKVAIKFLPSHLTKDNESRERFEREAQAAAALKHPNIVTVYEIGEFEEIDIIGAAGILLSRMKKYLNSPFSAGFDILRDLYFTTPGTGIRSKVPGKIVSQATTSLSSRL